MISQLLDGVMAVGDKVLLEKVTKLQEIKTDQQFYYSQRYINVSRQLVNIRCV